jgi:hypothetical protein
MYAPQQEAVIIVEVESPDGTARYVTWKGATLRGLRRAVRAAYPGCVVRFGFGYYRTL